MIAPLAGYLIHRFGWRDTFGILGAGFLAVTVAGSMFLRNPPERGGALRDGALRRRGKGRRGAAGISSRGRWRAPAPSAEMWIAYAFGTAAGLMVIRASRGLRAGGGVLRPRCPSLRGLLSVGNGCGRIASRWMSDYIGRVRTLSLAMGATAPAPLPRPRVSHRAAALCRRLPHRLLLRLWLAVFPSTTAEHFFGMRNLGNNYGLLLTAWGWQDHRPDGGGWIFDAPPAATPRRSEIAALARSPPPRGGRNGGNALSVNKGAGVYRERILSRSGMSDRREVRDYFFRHPSDGERISARCHPRQESQTKPPFSFDA